MSSMLAASSLPPTPENSSPVRGTRLPRPFLRSLRTLFEILDDQRNGTVHLSEIESRWGHGGSGVSPREEKERCQLPAGVLQALQQVAEPCGGYLSFPRLVAGLRIALLRAEEEDEGGAKAGDSTGAREAEGGQAAAQQAMKNSSRMREADGKGVTRSRSINSSLCQAGHRRSLRIPKEPRRHTISNAVEYDVVSRSEERLSGWGSPCLAGMPGWPPPLLLWALLPPCHPGATMAVQRGYTILIIPLGTALGSLEALRFFFWVSGCRIHASSGADSKFRLFPVSQLKRMQELERERDALLHGLEMVDRMRGWFQRHLLEAQRRQKHLGAQAEAVSAGSQGE
ncbi:hypothetical protein lerEdw1_010300 [Lerista edwardsae]|nr:hypothetical protein lerEdw1_010300 [Lerista edwardsae]